MDELNRIREQSHQDYLAHLASEAKADREWWIVENEKEVKLQSDLARSHRNRVICLGIAIVVVWLSFLLLR